MRPKYVINIHQHLHLDQNLDERIKLWRKCNVRKTCVLSQPSRFRSKANGQYFDNEDTVQWLKRYPKDLVGMGCIDVGKNPDPPEKVDELKEQGFAGLKFIYAYYPYNHEIYFPIYARAEKLGIPILFHTGFLAISGDGSDGQYGIDCNNYRPYLFDKIARAFPNLKIIGAHLGRPHTEEAISMLMAHRNIYFDFSGGSGKKSVVLSTLKALSPPIPDANMMDPEENPALNYFKKLCFGTDNPEPPIWIEASDFLMDRLCIPQETRELFYWKNACEIFGWDESDL